MILFTGGVPKAEVSVTVLDDEGFCPADFDFDRDVDAADLAFFVTCMSGPSVPHAGGACSQADFDKDGDVDQADFGSIQRCLDRSGAVADADCVDS